jgi:hypothetical protein
VGKNYGSKGYPHTGNAAHMGKVKLNRNLNAYMTTWLGVGGRFLGLYIHPISIV